MRSAGRLMFCSLVLFVAVAAGCSKSPVSAEGGFIRGAQHFKLQDTDGGTVALDDLLQKNKLVMLNFWATWCPYCRKETPAIINIQKRFDGKGLAVVGIDLDESVAKVKAYAKKAGIGYPMLIDRGAEVAGLYEVVGVPTNILIRSDGKILAIATSAVDLVQDIEANLE